MRAGRLNKWVTLDQAPQVTADHDGYWEALSPNGAYCSIQPLSPGENGRSIQHLVVMRFHPQVTMDTRLRYDDPVKGTRYLGVKGFQNLDESNVELRLVCEEIIA